MKPWLCWSTRSTKTWRETRISTAATTCWHLIFITSSACPLLSLHCPRQVSVRCTRVQRKQQKQAEVYTFVGICSNYLLISVSALFPEKQAPIRMKCLCSMLPCPGQRAAQAVFICHVQRALVIPILTWQPLQFPLTRKFKGS